QRVMLRFMGTFPFDCRHHSSRQCRFKMDPPDIDSVPTPRAYATAQMANVVAAVRDLQHPTRIGPYEILELIGEGGMGSVYKAEQRQPIQRIVAIKIIKLGMDARQVISRFESER